MSSGNNPQASLIGGHAEYVKGTAEVSIIPSMLLSKNDNANVTSSRPLAVSQARKRGQPLESKPKPTPSIL